MGHLDAIDAPPGAVHALHDVAQLAERRAIAVARSRTPEGALASADSLCAKQLERAERLADLVSQLGVHAVTDRELLGHA